MRSVVLWVLLLLALSLFLSYTLRAQDSGLVLPMSAPLWETLLPATSSLPAQMRAYRETLMRQVAELQSNNDSLKQENEGLRTSLEASQADLLTSKLAQQRLQTALDASTRSITRAQSEAKALQAENRLLRLGGGAIVVGALVYIVGHAAGAW